MSRRILVALDWATASERVLPWASRIARGWGAAVHLVVICLPLTSVVGGWSAAFIDQERARARGEALTWLRVLAARFEDDGVAVTTEVRFGEARPRPASGSRRWSRPTPGACAGTASSTCTP